MGGRPNGTTHHQDRTSDGHTRWAAARGCSPARRPHSPWIGGGPASDGPSSAAFWSSASSHPFSAGAYGGNNFGAQPGQYAGKPPADYYAAPTGAGGFSSGPPPSLNDMATDAQKRIAAAQQRPGGKLAAERGAPAEAPFADALRASVPDLVRAVETELDKRKDRLERHAAVARSSLGADPVADLRRFGDLLPADAARRVGERGFVNYFGLQRFGTGATSNSGFACETNLKSAGKWCKWQQVCPLQLLLRPLPIRGRQPKPLRWTLPMPFSLRWSEPFIGPRVRERNPL